MIEYNRDREETETKYKGDGDQELMTENIRWLLIIIKNLFFCSFCLLFPFLVLFLVVKF